MCMDPGNTGEGWSGLVQYWLQCTAMYTVQRHIHLVITTTTTRLYLALSEPSTY